MDDLYCMCIFVIIVRLPTFKIKNYLLTYLLMTVVKIHCFYHCLLIEISSDVDAIK